MWDFSSQIRKVLFESASQTRSKISQKKFACAAKIYSWFKINCSYGDIYLNDNLATLFEGLLLARLTTHIELDNTLTSNQRDIKLRTQTLDAIYSLISTIQYNKYTIQKPTYVAFVDYSTAYPSMHRDRLSIPSAQWHCRSYVAPPSSSHWQCSTLSLVPQHSRLSNCWYLLRAPWR